MQPHKVAALRATYPSLVDLVAGVKDALELRDPLISIPRLLVGQNVKHNGYFVRAFMSDSDEEALDTSASVDEVESPMELEEVCSLVLFALFLFLCLDASHSGGKHHASSL